MRFFTPLRSVQNDMDMRMRSVQNDMDVSMRSVRNDMAGYPGLVRFADPVHVVSRRGARHNPSSLMPKVDLQRV